MAETASTTAAAAPYVPPAAAASLRMADAMHERHGGARGQGGPLAAARRTQKLVDRVFAGYLGEPAPGAARSASQADGDKGDGASQRTPAPLTVLSSFVPSEVVRAGFKARDAEKESSPLWGILPAAKLEPVVAALESSLGLSEKPAEPPQRKEPAVSAPSLTLLQGGSDAPARPRAAASVLTPEPEQDAERPISRAAMEASSRLLEALRAHASAQATAGSERVSLGDLTTIAFADSKRRMAAHSASESVPEPKAPESAPADSSNKNILRNHHYTLAMVTKLAKDLVKEMSDKQKTAETRYGDA
jgi:hypothetical protein